MNKRSRILSLFLTLCMVLVCSISAFALDLYTFGDTGPGSATTTNTAIVVEKIETATKVDSASMIKAMGGVAGDTFVDGKVTFKDGTTFGILAVVHKGTTYELIKVQDGAASGSVIEVNVSAFRDAKQTYVIKATRVFTDALAKVVDADTAQQIMQDIQDSDTSVSTVMLPLIFDATKADLYTAYTITNPFLEILNIVLGVVAVALIFLVFFTTAWDMCYIGIPALQNGLASANKDNADAKPFGVSYEAFSSVKACTDLQSDTYKNVWFMYLRRRAMALILLSVCIMFLICGGLSGIISGVLKLVSGLQF